MQFGIGEQYKGDDEFKSKARLHQSRYRKDILSVDYNEYGNRFKDEDAKKLLNYYEHLNVRKTLRKRYPNYSKRRDADMLRSEHIPFNLFAPLEYDFALAKSVISKALDLNIKAILKIDFEYAPKPISKYLDDGTAFDTYIEYLSANDDLCGIGIEVKYTEKSYPILKREKANVENPNSKYWTLTKKSKIFKESKMFQLVEDDMRQIWRNHLLGISLVENKKISNFTSVILYPSGNHHFNEVIPLYKSLLTDESRDTFRGLLFEKYIGSIQTKKHEIVHWKNYLKNRYIVK